MKKRVFTEEHVNLLLDAVDFFLEQQSFCACDAAVPKLEEISRHLSRAHEVIIVTDEDN